MNEEQEESFQVFIRTVDGKTILVYVKGDDTVQELFQIVEERLSFPSDAWRMVFKGRELQRDWTLSDCGVLAESTLNLRLKIRCNIDYQELLSDKKTYL